MKKIDFNKAAIIIGRFLFFLGFISFIVTASILLFVDSFEFNREIIERNAKNTLFNVIFLSLLFCTGDIIYKKITVSNPVKKIINALNKITSGDFSVKIPKIPEILNAYEFNTVIDSINTMTKEISSVETLRTDFIANVSHELKTPLSIISNYSTLLQSENLTDEERKSYAKSITDTSKRLAGLITNILKLNKLENQTIFPSPEKYNLSEQICECLLSFESIWEEKNISIENNIDDEIFIESDNELLSLIWNNLFSNAFKFTDTGGTVSVSLKEDKDKIIFSVTDTGCGINSETGRHIFEKFYQDDSSHTNEGYGLGLALVKRIVDISGGEISVKSKLNEGSTFTVGFERSDT